MAQDLAELIPRTKRAIEGPAGTAGPALTDDQVKGLIADAVAEVVFFTGGVFGHQLLVTARDATYNAPSEWEVDPVLEPDEETVIVACAALAYFFHEFKDLKVSEQIANEGAQWQYQLSANVVLEQMRGLRSIRDAALERVADNHMIPTQWVNLLEARDLVAATAVEPFQVSSGAGGQAIYP